MKLHSLQGLRAIAAWMVVTDHALLELTDNRPQNPLSHLAWSLGNNGVYVFFVISGFIMVHICWESFGRAAAPASFLRRRIIRIVPLYWIATVLALCYHRVSATYGAHAGWVELLRSLAFIPYGASDGSWRPVLAQGWTLNYEMMFYAFFAFGLLFPRRVALAVVGAGLGVLVLDGPSMPDPTIAYLASPIVLWFVLGMGLGTIWHWQSLREPGWLARLARVLEPFGDASYSTYLAHGLILTMVLRFWVLTMGAPSFWLVPISILAATCGGWVIHVTVERPALRTITDMWRPRQEAPSGRKAPSTT